MSEFQEMSNHSKVRKKVLGHILQENPNLSDLTIKEEDLKGAALATIIIICYVFKDEKHFNLNCPIYQKLIYRQ